MNIKNHKMTFILLINLIASPLQAKKVETYTLPSTEVIPVQDSISNRAYELYIKLPKNYNRHAKTRYPVIYFTDAQWHMELLSGAATYLMEQAILVGISWQTDIQQQMIDDHGIHVSRYRDYSIQPARDPVIQEKYELGQADNHIAFIRNNVFPTVENRYRVEPNNRTYFGYSAGATFASYILMVKPDTFNHYIIGSPALDGDIPIFKRLSSNSKVPLSTSRNVFISHGDQEKELGQDVKTLISLLNKAHPTALNITKEVIAGDHKTSFPLTGVKGLIWLSQILPRNKP